MRISVVIPAKNEELLLPYCLQSLKNAGKHVPFDIEVVVVLDCCKDTSATIALEFGAKTMDVNFSSRSRSRNIGAYQSTGEIIVFLDADTVVPADFFAKSVTALSAGTEVLWYGQEALEINRIAPLYFILINFLGRFRPFFSPAITVRKDYFAAGGRFDEDLGSFEDLHFLVAAWKAGRAILCDSSVKTSVRRVVRFGYARSILHFIRASINPTSYKWRAIHE